MLYISYSGIVRYRTLCLGTSRPRSHSSANIQSWKVVSEKYVFRHRFLSKRNKCQRCSLSVLLPGLRRLCVDSIDVYRGYAENKYWVSGTGFDYDNSVYRYGKFVCIVWVRWYEIDNKARSLRWRMWPYFRYIELFTSLWQVVVGRDTFMLCV